MRSFQRVLRAKNPKVLPQRSNQRETSTIRIGGIVEAVSGARAGDPDDNAGRRRVEKAGCRLDHVSVEKRCSGRPDRGSKKLMTSHVISLPSSSRGRVGSGNRAHPIAPGLVVGSEVHKPTVPGLFQQLVERPESVVRFIEAGPAPLHCLLEH